MKKYFVITVTVLLLVAGFVYALTTAKSEWTLDKSHARLNFSVTHLMVSEVEGSFNKFDGKIVGEKEDFSDAVATMTAQVISIDTDNDKRDTDLLSANYFDAAKYPTITFKSRSFTKVDDKNYKVAGDLTIHGITQPVELNAYNRMGANPMNKKSVAGFKVTGKINRLDFAVGPSAPVAMVGNEVEISANVEFQKSPLP